MTRHPPSNLLLKTPSGACRIRLGEGAARRLRNGWAGRSCVVVTDRNLRRLHGPLFEGLPAVEIGTGERAKSLRTAAGLYDRFLELGLDRSSWVIGFGGGVVCDAAGFAAATYMRGLRLLLIPTTLLAQVDAAVGGKNAVNVRGRKNLVGTFHPPDLLWLDPALLRTLPAAEIRSGAAEIVKHGLIARRSLFTALEKSWRRLLDLDPAVVRSAVRASLDIKSSIVRADERERGRRRRLNFGHTFGHALEAAHGLRHGEAVAIGMVLAARISAARGLLAPPDVGRIERLLRNLGLPTRVPPGDLAAWIAHDKKRRGERLGMVLLAGIGRARVVEVPVAEIEEMARDLREHRHA